MERSPEAISTLSAAGLQKVAGNSAEMLLVDIRNHNLTEL
jgi:hypothetical protein